MSAEKVQNVVVVGGGTAGWTAAASIARLIGVNLNVTLVESDAIGTVGVGEATIPPFRTLHRLLKIDEAEFLSRVQGTIKLGIQFENWRQVGHDYIHSFGFTGQGCWAAGFQHFWLKAKALGFAEDYGRYAPELMAAKAGRFGLLQQDGLSYAYHLDATSYAKYLRELAEKDGVTRVEGKIVEVRQAESGDISEVVLDSGKAVKGDLFIDCSGFRGLLIEQALKTGWEDWGHWLRSDRAVALQTESVAPPPPYTRATARSCGWQWKIPLQNRVGNGLVYSSAFLSEDEATKLLLDNVEGRPITEPRTLRFRTGRRLRQWNRNCVALGLASGFLEPLESTSIHLIQNSIIRLIKLFPSGESYQAEIDQFNREVKTEIEYIRDFIILHYHLTQRADTPYWDDCQKMTVPETLSHKLQLFGSGGKIFRDNNELFSETSWIAVMVGQGLVPAAYHPFADNLDDRALKDLMARVRGGIAQLVERQPAHRAYLDRLCGPAVS